MNNTYNNLKNIFQPPPILTESSHNHITLETVLDNSSKNLHFVFVLVNNKTYKTCLRTNIGFTLPSNTSRGRAAVARRAHNPKVGGSIPSLATKLS